MNLLWLTVILLSLSWYPLTGFYAPVNIHTPTQLWFVIFSLFAAVVCGIASRPVVNFSINRQQSLAWLSAPAVGCVFLPFPYSLPAYFLLAAIGVALIPSQAGPKEKPGFLNQVSSSFFICGLIMAAQAALLPFFTLFASRFHRLDWPAPVMAFLIDLFGVPASSADGELFVQSSDKVFTFIPSWEMMAHFAVLNILLGGFILFLLFKMPKKSSLVLLGILALYMPVRAVAMILSYLNLESANVFWRLDLLSASLLPLLFLLNHVLPLGGRTKVKTIYLQLPTPNKRLLAPALLFALSVACWAGFFGFADPGNKKAGRILIDEKHSDWEWTTEAFGTNWYGEKSTYNYYSLAEYLKQFYSVEQNFETITNERLADYDILLIKTPTTPFSQQEISAMRMFVENGGGLFMVGDHTNVFGITTNLNPLASQFGFKYRYDGQYDLDGELSLYEKPEVMPHPVVQNMPRFMFATGCMLEAPLLADNAIIGYGVKSLYLDYSQRSFFPKEAKNNEAMEFGLFPQAAGAAFGKGRVFLFTDSTVWSNFYMFIPGKPELLLGIIEWLNRENSLLVGWWLRQALLILGCLTLLSALFKAAEFPGEQALLILLFTGLITMPVVSKAIEMSNRLNYPLPTPHTKFTQVAFESQYSHFELPVYHVTQQADHSYHTFYVWLQRLGLFPTLKTTYAQALQESDVVVVINPSRSFSASDLEQTDAFLQRGGRLFIIDDPRHHGHQHANELLGLFGVNMHPTPNSLADVRLFRTAVDTNTVKAIYAGVVQGGRPRLFAKAFLQKATNDNADRKAETDTGKLPVNIQLQPQIEKNEAQSRVDTTRILPVLATKNVGRGMLAALATSFLFTDKQMGSTMSRPDDMRRRIYELEYWMFRDVLELGSRKMTRK